MVQGQTCTVDMYVANDQSGSVSSVENAQSRQFISALMTNLQPWGTAPGESRMAIADWDYAWSWTAFSFPVAGQNYTTLLADVVAYQNAPRYLFGGTDPYDALLRTYQNIDQTPIPGRAAKRTIVLMTDADCSQVPSGISFLASQIKDAGIYVMVVAIEAASGCPSLAGTNVASPGGYFSAPSYADLVQSSGQLVYDIINSACVGSPFPGYDLAIGLNDYVATGCIPGPGIYTVDYTVMNSLFLDFSGDLRISFYNGDPALATTQFIAMQDLGVVSIPMGGVYNGSFISPLLQNSSNLVAVVNFDGTLPGNSPPFPPYLTGRTYLTDEGNCFNNVSNGIARVADASCPPYAVVTTNVVSGGLGCGSLANYEIAICNTGDADVLINSTLPITAPGTVLVADNTQPQNYTNGLLWATYCGGASTELGYRVATDPLGNVYITGTTSSTTGISTPGAFKTAKGGGADAFLVKFDPSGTRLWGTYYGGAENDDGIDVTTDAAGNVYLVGSTEGSAGLATAGTYQTNPINGSDAFVVKFNSAGVRQWGSYYGGGNEEFGEGVAVDALGNVFISGMTEGGNTLASPGAHQIAFGGASDMFMVKFNNSGVRQWATYYGGTGEEIMSDIATDPAGNVFLVGQTQSVSAIATVGSHQSFNNGDDDVFLAKFTTNGVRVWGTYYGGPDSELSPCVTTDNAGFIYLGGQTTSTAFIAAGAIHQVVLAGLADGFIVKFNTNGVRQWGDYFGGEDDDAIRGVIADQDGNVYVTGPTLSTTGIATFGSYQTTPTLQDAFMAKFTTSGDVPWATYYGGPDNEEPYGIAVDAMKNVFISGTTPSTTMISTTGAHQVAIGGGTDAYLAKFNEREIGFLLIAGDCITREYVFDYSGVAPGNYDMSFGVVAEQIALTDGLPVVLPDNNFDVGAFLDQDGFNGTLHSSDDITVSPGPPCPPGDQITVAVDITPTISCGNGNFIPATVTINNTSGTTAFNTELYLQLTGAGATFATELYTISTGLLVAIPNVLDPSYPFVPYALAGYNGIQLLPIQEIPPGTSTFTVDINMGIGLMNLSVRVDSLHSSMNASGSSNLAQDTQGVLASPDPVISGYNCPASVVAGSAIPLAGISATQSAAVLWSSTTQPTLVNAGTLNSPALNYSPTPMDVANGFVAISLAVSSANGCVTATGCQVDITNVQYDYGDAPVSYDLNVNYQPPAAASTLYSGLNLGLNAPFTELLANNSVMADGDGSEEDGLAANPYTVPYPPSGATFTLPVRATDNQVVPGYLHAYVDWDADGDFLDTLESSLNTRTVPSGSGTAWYNMSFVVPPVFNNAGLFYIRLRFSTDSNAVKIPYMAAPQGETEDYVWSSVGPLPVEMLDFSGEDIGPAVDLSWVTASENNSSHFILERSADALQFNAIAQLPAAGNSQAILHYGYQDEFAFQGVVYYRLKEVDNNGAVDLYGPIPVVRGNEQGVHLVQTDGRSVMVLGIDPNGLTMELTDIAGRSCKTVSMHGAQVGFETLASGVYVANLSRNGLRLLSQKVVVE